jgi:hypothetical protein
MPIIVIIQKTDQRIKKRLLITKQPIELIFPKDNLTYQVEIPHFVFFHRFNLW